jgi:hypothetical protein
MANFIGTVGNDTQDGTNSADIFDYQQGGRDTLNGKGGNDLFVMGSEGSTAAAAPSTPSTSTLPFTASCSMTRR